MAIELTDDGTLDTVLRCSDCGEEMRYNYDAGFEQPEDAAGSSVFTGWAGGATMAERTA